MGGYERIRPVKFRHQPRLGMSCFLRAILWCERNADGKMPANSPGACGFPALRVLFVLTVFVFATGCGCTGAAENRESVMPEVVLGTIDHGGVIKVVLGSRVLLRLPENPTTGYQWVLEPFRSSALELRSNRYQMPSEPGLGSLGVRVFVFRARSPGTVTLRLCLKRPWEPTENAAKSFEVTLCLM
ncbi:MAG: hypothetical protein D3910_23220 [Candidatus Electrothrix sp. ATG2]|nr:hypothetical protein [Candidatus Electrothrix sp. ATG2]